MGELLANGYYLPPRGYRASDPRLDVGVRIGF